MKPNHRVHEPIIPCNPPVCRAHRAKTKPGPLDGDLSKPFWQEGEWLDDFHDIEGDSLPKPWKKTRVKVLWDEEGNRLEGYDPRLQIQRRMEQLQYLQTEMNSRFQAAVQDRRRSLELLSQDLQRKMELALQARRHRCEVLITRLHGLSPTAKLVQGFGYISLHEKPVTDIRQVKEGDPLRIRIHDGEIRVKVTEVHPAPETAET